MSFAQRLVRDKNGEYCELISGYQCVPPRYRGYNDYYDHTGLFYESVSAVTDFLSV